MKNATTNLQYTNLPYSALQQQSTVRHEQILGAICFSAEQPDAVSSKEGDVPFMHVAMQPLANPAAMCEVWHSCAQLTQGQSGSVTYRCNENEIFGVVTLAEDNFVSGVEGTPLQQATEAAYRQIITLLDTLHYPYVFRFWNYMSDINGQSDDLERYQQFNLGRQNAFLAQARQVQGNVPAACALGTTPGNLSVAFLAGRIAPVAIENPRQISAYTYPPVYGPRSPTFSRASLVCMAECEWLFISGTASIVGHASLHRGDVIEQTRETMTNIEAVVAEANKLARLGTFDLAGLHYKVYVKHAADLAHIRAELESRTNNTMNAVYLQADICRQELLVEIEATAWHALQTESRI